jgi:hypothetical protein
MATSLSYKARKYGCQRARVSQNENDLILTSEGKSGYANILPDIRAGRKTYPREKKHRAQQD